MTRLPAFAAAFAALFLVHPPARAGYGITVSAEYSLGQSIVPEPTGYRPDLSGGKGAGGSGVAFASVADGGSLEQASASAAAAGGLYGPLHDLRLGTFATGEARSYLVDASNNANGQFVAGGAARWTDTFYLTPAPGQSLPAEVTMEVEFDGVLTALGNALPDSVAWIESDGSVVRSDDQPTGTLSKAIRLDAGGRAEYGLYLASTAFGVANPRSSSNPGSELVSATADFSHTLEIRSILMTDPDGNLVTPESLGYTLTFESGMRSPNFAPAAVPEPASLSLLAAGGLGLLGFARRRAARRTA